jgi:uncharacterized protein YraI
MGFDYVKKKFYGIMWIREKVCTLDGGRVLMKPRYWSLAIVLLLINYLIFAALFTRLLDTNFDYDLVTHTPIPTFTPAPAQPFIIIPTLTPIPVIPTATATRVLSNGNISNGEPPAPAEPPPAPQAQLVAPGSINIRSGPGIGYEVIGTLNANTPRPIIGRNADASWWQIQITEGEVGWVAGTVVTPTNTDAVPMVEASPGPLSNAPTAPEAQTAASESSLPAPPPQERYQFTPTGWYDDGNQGITRFLGDIKDAAGNPVDGVFVRVSCGYYSTISYPSGPVGWGTLNESADWPPGFYDITVDEKPVPCIWTLSIVDTEDRKTVKAVLSEEIPVEVTLEKSVIVAGWQKNW